MVLTTKTAETTTRGEHCAVRLCNSTHISVSWEISGSVTCHRD